MTDRGSNPVLRDVWETGAVTVGGWLAIPSAVTAEVMSRLEFDWLCIDTQHGLVGYQEMLAMIQALSITATPALVRVAWNDPGLIGSALDAGAQGVVVPMINSAEEARRAVGACRYPPEGYRSWGPIRNALQIRNFSPQDGNRRAACLIMLETREAVDAVDEILAVPGIDGVYLGPMDMSVSYGLPPGGLLTDRSYDEVFTRIAGACERHGCVPGTHCPDVATAKRFRDWGYRILNVAGDARFLRAGAETVLRGLGIEARAIGSGGGYA